MLPNGSNAPSPVQDCPARPGWTPVGRRQRGPATRARVGQALINARKASPTGPCCASAGRPGADRRRSGVADRTGAGERATNSTTTLVVDEAKHPIGDHSTRSDLAQCSRSGGIFSHGSNAPKRVEHSRSGAFLPMVRILSEALRRGRPSAGILPRRRLGPSCDQHVVSNEPAGVPQGAGHHATPKRRRTSDSATNSGQSDTRPRPVSRPRPRQ